VALALTALEQPDSAINDYEQALRLDSTLAPGVLNRGLLHYRANRLAAARADLQRALQLGANPATVYYNLALVCPAENDRVQALQNLREALVRDPEHRDARELQDKVSRQP
jgi:tetratricopeptide (TPR) repeat protein